MKHLDANKKARRDAAKVLREAADRAAMAGDIDQAVELRQRAVAFAPLCSDPLQEGCERTSVVHGMCERCEATLRAEYERDNITGNYDHGWRL